jgi:hypothetical protein
VVSNKPSDGNEVSRNASGPSRLGLSGVCGSGKDWVFVRRGRHVGIRLSDVSVAI